MSDFQSNNGSVIFYVETMPGCCGVSIIRDIIFRPTRQTLAGRNALYDDFQAFIVDNSNTNVQKQGTRVVDWDTHQRAPNGRLRDAWVVYKYLMSDRVYAPARDNSIQQFCEHNNWLGGQKTKNPRYNDHNIQVWEFDIQGTVKGSEL